MNNNNNHTTEQDVNSLAAELANIENAIKKLNNRRNFIKVCDLIVEILKLLPNLLSAKQASIYIVNHERTDIWASDSKETYSHHIITSTASRKLNEYIRKGKLPSSLGHGVGLFNKDPMDQSFHSNNRSSLVAFVYCQLTGLIVGAIQVVSKLNRSKFEKDDETLLKDIAFQIEPLILQLCASKQNNSRHLLSSIERKIAADQTSQALNSSKTTHDSNPNEHEKNSASSVKHIPWIIFQPLKRMETCGLMYTSYRDKKYPPFINPKKIEHLHSFWEICSNDILICTHQKVGTHLAKKLLVEIVMANTNHLDDLPFGNGDIGQDAVPWPEVMFSQKSEAEWLAFIKKTQKKPRIWYTHCAFDDFPSKSVHPKSKFIVVVREPKAAAVSQYYFWLRHPMLGANTGLKINTFIDAFTKSELYFGGYHQHSTSWICRSKNLISDDQVCLLFYEDMVENKLETINKIQNFLYPEKNISRNVVSAIASSSEFSSMKNEISSNPRSFHIDPNLYFRTGTTDGWKDKLPPSAIKKINNLTQLAWGAGSLSKTMMRYLSF